MSTSSEAVMVSPEQCATAPKTFTKELAAAQQAPSSATRLVLLSVLALAAASGAMFGVVIFGNEFTKDVHPKGDAHLNAVTLVDTNDRAIATADVESYVSLLDLPLLGTAELNKVDGITFSTYQGVQHRKVTGYDITKETATVGDSVVESPRLSLTTSDSGVTVEVSVRDARAWVQHTAAGVDITTEINLPSQRRLAEDSGSCLANGACLYSQDELLRVSAANRELSDGSFFARADVAAYQVDLNGDDVMQYISTTADDHVTYLEGSYAEGGHQMQLRASTSAAGAMMLFTNRSSRISKLFTVNGTWLFEGEQTTGCVRPTTKTEDLLSTLNLEELAVAGEVPFQSVSVHTSTPIADFIPHHLTSLSQDDCLEQMISRSNLTDPAARKYWTDRTGVSFVEDASGNAARKLAKQHFKPLTQKDHHRLAYAEIIQLMSSDNEINRFWASEHGKATRQVIKMKRELKEMNEGKKDPQARKLFDSDFDSDSYYKDYDAYAAEIAAIEEKFTFSYVGDAVMAPDTYITHFDLWVCTRLADPTFLHNAYVDFDDQPGIVETFGYTDADGDTIAPSFIFDMSGSGGISSAFAAWAFFLPVQASYFPPGLGQLMSEMADTTYYSSASDASAVAAVGTVEQQLSKAFYHTMYAGSCSGGYEFNNDAEMDSEVGADLCTGIGFGESDFDSDYWEDKFEPVALRRRLKNRDPEFGDDRRRLYTDADGMGEAYKAFDSYCTSFLDDTTPEYSYDRYTLALKQGNSWASYLVKEVVSGYPEYVVAFQGTKSTDHSMIAYNVNQKPLFTYIGESPVIAPEGVYWYMESLAECLMWMLSDPSGFNVYPSTLSNKQPTFITGHSLGGNAATLFAKYEMDWTDTTIACPTCKYPRLVTFGSPPNVFRGEFTEGLIGCAAGMSESSAGASFLGDSSYCSGGSLTEAGYKEYAEDMGGIGNFCVKANPQSVRFFHKFDPVPSQAMWKGQFAHGVEHAMMLYDMPGSTCGDITTCSITSATLNAGESDFGLYDSKLMIKDYLCDKWGVTAKAFYTSCYDEITSYMSLLNPWPCGEIIFHRIWKEEWDTSALEKIGDNGVVEAYWGDEMVAALDFVALTDSMFVKFEEYTDCVAAYETSLSAYIQAMIVDAPALGSISYMVFGFLWVHSTYGNYPLCTDLDTSTGEIVATNVDSADLAKVDKNDCSSTYISYCETSCSYTVASSRRKLVGAEDGLNPWCLDECMYACEDDAAAVVPAV